LIACCTLALEVEGLVIFAVEVLVAFEAVGVDLLTIFEVEVLVALGAVGVTA
jgi:hypothetical protein